MQPISPAEQAQYNAVAVKTAESLHEVRLAGAANVSRDT